LPVALPKNAANPNSMAVMAIMPKIVISVLCAACGRLENPVRCPPCCWAVFVLENSFM